MRVYGASPLYSYVELVFRSKRLFIFSIVLATAIVSVLAMTRTRTYTATAGVLLSEPVQQGGAQNPNEEPAGNGRLKFTILNNALKKQLFIKGALTEAHLNQYSTGNELSPSDLDKLVKDVQKALTISSDGNSYVEITCRWKDEKAKDYVLAFYDAYHREVLDQEEILNVSKIDLLQKLADDYEGQQKALEANLTKYKAAHPLEYIYDDNAASQLAADKKHQIEDDRLQIRMAQEQHGELVRQLANTPKEINVEVVHDNVAKGITDLPDATRRRDDAQARLKELELKYFPNHPLVKAAQAAFDTADARAKELEAQARGKKQDTGPIKSVTVQPNPEYARISTTVNDLDTRLKGMDAQLRDHEEQSKNALVAAEIAPQRNFSFRWMRVDYDLISSIRATLASRLQIAKLDQAQERQAHSAEIQMWSPPESEPELSGARSLMLYAAGPLLGIIIAFAFSLVSESLDHSLRTPVEVEKYLNKPVLAVLPRMDTPRKAQRQLGGGDVARPSLPS